MPKLLADITPLKISPAYRRIWASVGISNIGQQMTAVAVGLQIYDMTHSSLMVGLVGAAQLIPLIIFGLYGGVFSDVYDRRLIGLLAAVGMWITSVLFFTQSLMGNQQVWPLYLIIACSSTFFAIGNPARHAIIPRIIPEDLLPAANALGMITWNFGFTIGPFLGGALVAAFGSVTWVYFIDVIAYATVIWAMWRLPKIPPIHASGEKPKVGTAAVVEGFRYLKGKKNLQMSFYEDIIAMVFGMPRALFPAIAVLWYGGSTRDVAFTLGALSAAPALGAFASGVLSGPLGKIRRQGLAVVISIVVWGAAITAFGLTRWLPLALLFLAIAGAADNVSAVMRTTILQAATPDEYRGRLQGVFTVVVAGGPRLGDVEAGVVAAVAGEAFSVITGGIACIVLAVGLAAAIPSFVKYDARHPVP